MVIVESEGKQSEMLSTRINFAEPKGEFIYNFDTVVAPGGGEVESQIFEGEILEFFFLIGFGINHRAVLCQHSEDIHLVTIIMFIILL
jgi:hypothetical protein